MKFLRESSIVRTPMRTKEKRSSIVTSYSPFSRDIFKYRILTPHEEMKEVMYACDGNTLFESAVNTATDFIMGKDIIFKSDNEFSKDMVEAWFNEINGEGILREAVENTIKTGNSYIEQDFYNPMETKGMLIPKKLYSIQDSSMIYINCNEYGEPLTKQVIDNFGQTKNVENLEEYYVQEISRNIRHEKARDYTISYYGTTKGYGGVSKQVYGIPIDKRKIIHIRLNLGKTGLYGRSQLASAINDNEMLYEMERSIAVLAKYKAVPRKVWSIGDKDMPASEDEVDSFMWYLESLDKEDDIWVNKPISSVDISYAGQEMNLSYAIDHIKKKMIAGVSLDFLSGMGGESNRATATQELLAFILSIYSKRKIFLRVFQKEIIDRYVKFKGLSPVKIEFDDLNFETKAERENRIRMNWQSNMITFEEMREQMGLPTNVLPKYNDKLNLEIQMESQSAMFGGMGGDGFEEIPNPNDTQEKLDYVKNLKVPENYNINNNEVKE